MRRIRLYIPIIFLSLLWLLSPGPAHATDSYTEGAFTEDHINGDHYKTTDSIEIGGHGWQLSSAILKDLANGVLEPEESYGYVQGANPFTQGLLDTNITLIPPLYTLPCPEWTVYTPAGGPTASDDGPAGPIGDCLAQANPTDPQTNPFTINVFIPGYGWILLAENDMAEVLDDLYQAVGIDDSVDSVATNGKKSIRFLDQSFDILFYMKDEDPLAANGYYSVSGKLFFDQTLDQDLADYYREYAGTTVGDPLIETKGIFGKLTNLFTFDQSQNPVEYIDQWVVSEMYDWQYYNGADPDLLGKYAGLGVQQEYSSWFLKGDPYSCPDINGEGPCTYTYVGGHGDVTKTVSLPDHGSIDP